mgnify:CR=1 FL=1
MHKTKDALNIGERRGSQKRIKTEKRLGQLKNN